MIETIKQIDSELFLYLNSLHSPLFDKIMYFISYNKFLVAGLILFLFALSLKQYKKKFIGIFFFCLLAFGLSDSISSRIFKPGFKRLRPCHEKAIAAEVHLAGQNCWGGKFGFVSSHAANSFALATFFWLLLKAHYSFTWLLFVHSALVSYSRIYLGKHYPLDLIFGAMLGILMAYLSYRLTKKIVLKN